MGVSFQRMVHLQQSYFSISHASQYMSISLVLLLSENIYKNMVYRKSVGLCTF